MSGPVSERSTAENACVSPGKRVAIFLTSMRVGGAQRVALNLCIGLVDRGYDVDLLLVEKRGDLLEELPASVRVVNLNTDRVVTALLPLWNYLRCSEPDVLYAMMTEINFVSIVAHRLSRTRTKLVISEHNMLTTSVEGRKDELLIKLISLFYPLADHIVTVSQGVRDDLLSLSSVPAGLTSVIYNPINVESIRRQAAEPVGCEWFSSDEVRVVISAGRHVPQKGFDTLVRAFARIDDPDLRLVLLGEGRETESLKRLADELDISDRVCFMGFVDNPFSYLGRADVFVLSSWYEGFGNILIEAMATGCPVVSTDCPSGPAEILNRGEYGPLVEVRSPIRLSDAIQRTLTNHPSSETLVARASEFAIQPIIQQYEHLFFDTLN